MRTKELEIGDYRFGIVGRVAIDDQQPDIVVLINLPNEPLKGSGKKISSIMCSDTNSKQILTQFRYLYCFG